MRALTGLIAASLLLACASAPAAVAVPAKFWGVVPQSPAEAERLVRIKRGGVDSIRISISWSSVQPEPNGPVYWSEVDSAVSRAAAAGIDVLPYFYGAPSWAVPPAVVPGTRGRSIAPRNLPARGAAAAGWSSFLKLAVARYGPNGAFWAENPGLRERPIRTWQIWNEANFKYFVVRPNPAEYGKLVSISSAAIKSVDPRAKVVLGGLFARPGEAQFKAKPPQAYFATDFLRLMYKRTPGIKSKFDGIALHPYTGSFRNLSPQIEEVRDVLEVYDRGASLWITEVGWSSGKPAPNNSFNKGPAGQVRQLKGAFSVLVKNQVRWRLKGVFWFSLEDGPPVCNFCEGAGLFGPSFEPKRSWYAYVKFSGGQAN